LGKIILLKKGRVEKILSWVGEKNTLLQALVSALPCAACKSVFFCALAFYNSGSEQTSVIFFQLNDV
jgi:hypothetical protein